MLHIGLVSFRQTILHTGLTCYFSDQIREPILRQAFRLGHQRLTIAPCCVLERGTQAASSRKRDPHLSATERWMADSFEICSGFAIPCRSVFTRYLLQSSSAHPGAEPLRREQIGILVHKLFRGAGLGTFQLRSGKTRTHYYSGLRIKREMTTDGHDDSICLDLTSKPSPITMNWLHETFEAYAGHAIRCQDVHRKYVQLCETNNMRPLSVNHFGRLVRSTFYSNSDKVTKRHLGPRTCRRTYYEGLRLKESAENAQSILLDLVTNSSSATVQWIQDVFEVKPGYAFPCSKAYKMYRQHCLISDVRYLSSAHFTMLLRRQFASDPLKLRRLGCRAKRRYYYSGLNCKISGSSIEGEGNVSGLTPNRWEAALNDATSGSLLALNNLPEQSSNLSNNLQDIEDSYETLRRRIVSQLPEPSSVQMKIHNNVFEIRYRRCATEKDEIAFGLKSLCKIICFDGATSKPYVAVFKNFRNSLVVEERDRCFCGETCSPRIPKINDELTTYGLRRLLSFCEATSWNSNCAQIYQACVDNALLSPFEKLPAMVTAQAQTVDPLISGIFSVYPTLSLKKNHVVATPNGLRKKRIMDLYCEQLMLNIECNEHNHRNNWYDENYMAERESDIRKAIGPLAAFHYYDPHDVAFSVQDEVRKICDVIERISRDRNLKIDPPPCNAYTSSHLQSTTTARNQVEKAIVLAAELSTELLGGLRSKFAVLLDEFETRRKQHILSQDNGEVRSVNVTAAGFCHRIYCCVDKTVEGLLAVNRVSLCKALLASNGSSVHIYSNWRRSAGARNSQNYFAPPVGIIRRLRGPAMETESLTVAGVLSMLEYHEIALPGNVAAIRKAFVDHGLISPYSHLT